MKKLLILGWLLTLPQTLWLADDKEERQKEKVVSPLLAVLERDERCGQDGELGQEEIFSPRSSRSSLPLMSPTSTMSPTSPPPVGIRLGKNLLTINIL